MPRCRGMLPVGVRLCRCLGRPKTRTIGRTPPVLLTLSDDIFHSQQGAHRWAASVSGKALAAGNACRRSPNHYLSSLTRSHPGGLLDNTPRRW